MDDREPPTATEGFLRSPENEGRLASFVLVPVESPEDTLGDFVGRARRRFDRSEAATALDRLTEDVVEYVVGRQVVLVERPIE